MSTEKVIPRKQRKVTKLPEIRKNIASSLTKSVVRLFSRTFITPNILTLFGFALTLGATALIVTGNLFASGFVVLVAGFFDMLDGALARITDQVTRFGAILDSTLDRLSEAALMLGILVVFAQEQSVLGISITGAALIFSFLVSYIRSRAEASGLECEVGLFTRPERVIMLALGLLLSRYDYALTAALGIVAVFSLITASQRLFHVWRQTRK